jgi:glycosyltransferase involved in cell wall biosynthesis
MLVIAEGFPPLGGSGVQRTTKFVKYLPECGWRSAVVTADPVRDRPEELDESLLAEIPEGTAVLREPYWNPVTELRAVIPARHAPGGTFSALTTPTEMTAPASAGLLRRCYRGLRRLLAAPVGDAYYYWSLRIRRRALAFLRENRCSALYVSGSPFSSMLLGLWLKRRSGLPLVVDFRDPWTLFYPELARGLRFRIDRHFERKVLAGADAVICNHQPMREDFERIEPRSRGKCHVISNGFDPADFAAAPPPLEPNVLAHVGIAWEQSPHPVLRALAALRGDGSLPEGLRVRFTGGLPPSSHRMVAELGLGDIIGVTPRVAHAPAVAAMRSAGGLLLLLVGSQAGSRWYPGKLFEYMAAGRPIICVAPEGIATSLVRQSGCGVAFRPEDGAGLAEALREFADDPTAFAARHCRPKAEVLERFDRRRQAARLAGLLDSLVEGHD